MEFHNIYPQPQPRDLAFLEYLHPYSSPAPSAFFSSTPSDSYAVPTLEEGATGPLDAVVDTIFPAPLDSLDEFFSAKKRFVAKSVEEILGLVYERRQLKYDLFRGIDYESCRLGEKLLEMPAIRTGINVQLDRARGMLQKEIGGLDREKRMEEVACWRDLVRLQGELREALGEFEREKRRGSLLDQGAQ